MSLLQYLDMFLESFKKGVQNHLNWGPLCRMEVCNFTELRLWYRRFPVNFPKSSRTSNLQRQEWTNFCLGTRIFWCAILLARPVGHAKNGSSKPKCTSDENTTRQRTFYFHCKCVSIKYFALRFL